MGTSSGGVSLAWYEIRKPLRRIVTAAGDAALAAEFAVRCTEIVKG